jgi:SAM-dependent methyltransferase
MDRRSHWQYVYATKSPGEVSWYQPEAALSLGLIEKVAPARESAILDAGAGASRLVDGLLERGYRDVTLLDISAAALDQVRKRVELSVPGAAASVKLRDADILTVELPAHGFDVWHDRAVFHFLTDAADRATYVAQVRHALKPHGFAIIATFASDGPARCSGLDVQRYSPQVLKDQFGECFRLIESCREEHHTPRDAMQAFTYCVLQHEPAGNDRQ